VKTIAFLFVLMLAIPGLASESAGFALMLHGGAGNFHAEDLPEEVRQEYGKRMHAALDAGRTVLEADGSSVAAVCAVIEMLEDDPWFNAGRGAVLNEEGEVELDAAIMAGDRRAAGAVAAVRRVRHPIALARAIMEEGVVVMLVGQGAERRAERYGLELVDPEFFITDGQRRYWKAGRSLEGASDGALLPSMLLHTVGCVALDKKGTLAAGTSTGGRPGKLVGRIGDSPIIGVGTYAENGMCAVSATGDGEYFIRSSAARRVCENIGSGKSLQQAADAALADVRELGGTGGLIVLGPRGERVASFTTTGMFRAWIGEDGRAHCAFGKDP
jgi:L-asparaginase / beta-aspartyl-peptidase